MSLLLKCPTSKKNIVYIRSLLYIIYYIYINRSDLSTGVTFHQKFEVRTTNLELGTSNLEPRSSNFELGTSNFELRTTKFELGTSNLELGTSNLELRTSK